MSSTLGRPRTRPDTVQIQHDRDHKRLRYHSIDGIRAWAATALANARARAKKRGIQCTLTLEDVIGAAEKVTHCPILDIPLVYDRGHGRPSGNSASIDRIDNLADYDKDEVGIISTRANLLKNNCSVEELIQIGRYAEKLKEAS